jgi:signal transduction histidine kinase
MNQPVNQPQVENPQAELQALQLTCDRLRQQIQFQAAFLGTASHELRSPINQIISLHQLILEDLCESPTEEREFIAQANQTITTVLRNLDTLISLSKLDIGTLHPKLQSVELAPVLAAVQQFTEMKCINRHCRLTILPLGEPLAVQTDAQWLQQLLVTLVDAALTADSRTISLTATAPTPQGVTLELSCDGDLEKWPLPSPEPPTPERPLPPQAEFRAAISPHFGYQMAARMVHHLGGTITQSATPKTAQRWVKIDLPRSSQ